MLGKALCIKDGLGEVVGALDGTTVVVGTLDGAALVFVVGSFDKLAVGVAEGTLDGIALTVIVGVLDGGVDGATLVVGTADGTTLVVGTADGAIVSSRSQLANAAKCPHSKSTNSALITSAKTCPVHLCVTPSPSSTMIDPRLPSHEP